MNLSCSELAKRVGLSKSLISQVERGEVYPSIQTLEKLANALGVPLNSFFEIESKSESDNARTNCIIRKGQHKVILMPETHDRFHVLTPTISNNAFEFLLIEFPPHNPETVIDCFVHKGEECFLVLEGHLQLNLDGKIFELFEGDSGYFASYSKHSFRNNTDKVAKTIIASTSSIF